MYPFNELLLSRAKFLHSKILIALLILYLHPVSSTSPDSISLNLASRVITIYQLPVEFPGGPSEFA